MRMEHLPQDALHKRHLLCPSPVPDPRSSFWTTEQITAPLVLSPVLKFALGALQREATQGEPLASLPGESLHGGRPSL